MRKEEGENETACGQSSVGRNGSTVVRLYLILFSVVIVCFTEESVPAALIRVHRPPARPQLIPPTPSNVLRG